MIFRRPARRCETLARGAGHGSAAGRTAPGLPGFVLGMALLAAGCGQATFDPDCPQPRAGDAAEPIAAVPTPAGGIAVVHADTQERFCGGFLHWMDGTGAADGTPLLIEVPSGYEANFVGAAHTGNRVWIVGRRYGDVIGIDLETRRVARILRGTGATRVFAVDDELFGLWIPGANPRIEFRNAAGNLTASFGADSAPTVAAATANGAVWLAVDGGRFVRVVDRETGNTRTLQYPLGVGGIYRLRGMVAAGGRIWATDHGRGLVLSWDAGSGEPLTADPVGTRPEALLLDNDDRLWVADAAGSVWRLDGHEWQLLAAGLGRPSALLQTGDGVFVVDFASGDLSQVVAP